MKLREIKKTTRYNSVSVHDGLSRALPRVMQFNFDAVNYIDFAVSLLSKQNVLNQQRNGNLIHAFPLQS